MELTVIGSGTGALQTHRGPSGYVLSLHRQQILLDGGTGTLRRCLEVGLSFRHFDKVFYSHLHPDHTVDLVPLLFATKYTPGFTRHKSLELYGPIGFKQFYRRLIDLYRTGMTEVEYEIVVTELGEQACDFDSWKLRTAFMRHSENAIGFRFESEGKILVYSGDTDYCQGIVELASGADVLVLECSFPDHMKVAGHLTPSEAGRIASEAKVRKLILTHMYPPCDQEDILTPCKANFNGEVIKAEDLMRIAI